MDPLESCSLGDKLPVLRRQSAVAKPEHLVAIHGAAPHWTVFRPALWSCEQTFDQPFCDPPMVHDERQINVDQCVSLGESFPGRSNTAKAIYDPLVSAQ